MLKVEISSDSFDEIQTYYDDDLKVCAIKATRNETGLGLKEAKHLMDRVWEGESMDQVFHRPFSLWRFLTC